MDTSPKSRDYTFFEFVEESLIPDLNRMASDGLQYYAFPIICQAIEVMGGFYDNKPLDGVGMSEERFERGLKKLFKNRKYTHNQFQFYAYLRCAMVHQLRPSKEFLICSTLHNHMPREKHLDKQGDARIIVIEELISDFESAFMKLKNEAQKGGMGVISHKVSDVFLSVFELPSCDEFDLGSTSSPCVSGQL